MGFIKEHHFVLVHGAGHGAWCWVKIVNVLEKAGHRVTTVELASAGENNTDVADDISSLEEYSRPLEDLFASFPDDEKVILVGHSLGGMSLTRMSELFPKKISVAVYLTALMPAPGQDVNEIRVSDPQFFALKYEMKYNSKVEGGPVTSMEFPFDTLRNYYYNKCSPEDFAFAADRVKRFPALPQIILAVSGTKENYGSVPRVYVLPTHDKANDLYTAHKIITLNPPNEVYEIDADHSAFFSAVEEVERILIGSAEKYDS